MEAPQKFHHEATVFAVKLIWWVARRENRLKAGAARHRVRGFGLDPAHTPRGLPYRSSARCADFLR